MTPPRHHVIEPERRVPVAGEVDVLVAGGGPAGIAAGVAAAREGARTLVIERYGYLGGMITGAYVVAILGVGDGIRPKARGFTRDLYDRLTPLDGATTPGPSGDYRVDAEIFKWQAMEMLLDAGADVRLHTWACAPILDAHGRVAGAFTESKSGRQAFRARIVVDATADADLAVAAGCAFDNETHDVTLRVVVDGVDKDAEAAFQQEDPERHARMVAEAARLAGGKLPGQGRHLPGVEITDTAALTRVEHGFRRDAFRGLLHLREHLPGWENAYVRETAPQLGVRQGRRVRGLCTLTDADIRSSLHADDAIARLGALLEGYALYPVKGLDYDVPYRCMVPESVDGLLIAGRCVSSDYAGCNTLRLIVPCFATGQAAGVAAAIAARQNLAPRDVPIAELTERLVAQGVHLGARYPGRPASD